MLNVWRKLFSLTPPFMLLLFASCTPLRQDSSALEASLANRGDDLMDGTGEFRVFPDGTPESVVQFLNTKLPCNEGKVDDVHTRLLKAGCSNLKAITSYGQDGETETRLQPICPVEVRPQDRQAFLDQSICAGSCAQVELQFSLGVHGCAFYSAWSMLQY